jgi:ComF family protein
MNFSAFHQWKDAFTHLFFPQICPGCNSDLVNEQQMVCSSCMMDLPYTGFQDIKNNPVEKLFWGRTNIRNAFSVFYFIIDTPLQRMIHQIKYKNNQSLGIYLGNIMGNSLHQYSKTYPIDLLIPMPLHPKKEYRRGYNQSDLLCEGIKENLGIPFRNDILLRNFNTSTQTKKSRIERWENVSNVFALHHVESISDKHILLVDDVITTGASTEACAALLLKNKAASVSICSLAYTL